MISTICITDLRCRRIRLITKMKDALYTSTTHRAFTKDIADIITQYAVEEKKNSRFTEFHLPNIPTECLALEPPSKTRKGTWTGRVMYVNPDTKRREPLCVYIEGVAEHDLVPKFNTLGLSCKRNGCRCLTFSLKAGASSLESENVKALDDLGLGVCRLLCDQHKQLLHSLVGRPSIPLHPTMSELIQYSDYCCLPEWDLDVNATLSEQSAALLKSRFFRTYCKHLAAYCQHSTAYCQHSTDGNMLYIHVKDHVKEQTKIVIEHSKKRAKAVQVKSGTKVRARVLVHYQIDLNNRIILLYQGAKLWII